MEKSELLGGGDVDLIHITELKTIKPLCFYQMGLLHQHVATQSLSIPFNYMVLFQLEVLSNLAMCWLVINPIFPINQTLEKQGIVL